MRAWADKNRDGSLGAGGALAGVEIYYGGRQPSDLGGLTGADGTLLMSAPLRVGEQLFGRRAVYHEPAAKAGHQAVDDRMFTLWLDSDQGDAETAPGVGEWRPVTVTAADVSSASGGAPLDLRLGHPLFEWHLMVATEVTSSTFLNQFRAGFAGASEYLFDVTDGQMKFGKVAIYSGVSTNSTRWRQADMIIFNHANESPRADVGGIGRASDRCMIFGTVWGRLIAYDACR